MRQAWLRLGSPDAISWITIVAFMIQQVSGSLAAPMVDAQGRYIEFLSIRMTTLILFVAALGLGKLSLEFLAKSRPLPLLTLAIFTVATLVDLAALDGWLISAGFSEESTFWRRFLVAIPGRFPILIVCALLVTYAREFSRQNRNLAATVQELFRTKNEASARILKRKEELVHNISVELEDAISSLSTSPMYSAREGMKKLIDDVVRPMSYEIAREVKTDEAHVVSLPDTRISWREILDKAVRGNPVHPLASSLWIGLLVITFLTTGFGIRGLLGTLVLCAPVIGLMYLLRMAWKHIPQTWGRNTRTWLFSLAVITIYMVVTPGMSEVSGYNFFTMPTLIGWMIMSFFMTWTVTLVYAVNESLTKTNKELEGAVTELRKEVVILNNQYRLLQKSISRVLHGPIQEAITASIYRFQSGNDERDESALLEDVRSNLEQSLTLLEDPLEISSNLKTSLSNLVELWDEIVTIEVNISTEDLVRIQQDQFAVYAVIELVREACGNAIRHGAAKNIQVSITTTHDTNMILIVVANDGKPLIEGSKSGLGSQIFDEICLNWSRKQFGQNIRVDALIPLTK